MIQVIYRITVNCAVENTAGRQQMEWQVMAGVMKMIPLSEISLGFPNCLTAIFISIQKYNFCCAGLSKAEPSCWDLLSYSSNYIIASYYSK